ncbi:hypothetical protein ACH4TV_34465 [Streptomyces sp. NPDC020898]|uniref:hypothetical protein n=1 Tax=Streptomyces sp. NPDC020898 TaxID=3365101 RepID=UPI0037BAA371
MCGTHDPGGTWAQCRARTEDARRRLLRLDHPAPEGTVSLWEARVRRNVRQALEQDGY